ncbi:MAG: SGNH/GDSL hydrolase family protein [Planctomycetota bacterium]
MRRRLIGILAGLLGFVVISQLVVEGLDWRLKQPQAPKTVRLLEAFRESEGRVDIALLGSSRLHAAVCVPQLERLLGERLSKPVSARSFWIEAGSMPAYTIIARDVLKGAQKPDRIALIMGAGSFNSNSPRYRNTLRYLCSPRDIVSPWGPRRLDELPIAADVAFRAGGTLIQSWRGFSDAERQAAEVSERLGGGKYADLPAVARDASRKQFDRVKDRYAEEVLRRVSIRSRGTREDVLVDYHPAGRASDALKELIAICRERGIALVVVNIPLSDAFCEQTYRNREDTRYLEQVRAICLAAEVPFFDFNQPGERPPLTDFRDGDHLNEIGADRFTQKLAEEVFAR